MDAYTWPGVRQTRHLRLGTYFSVQEAGAHDAVNQTRHSLPVHDSIGLHMQELIERQLLTRLCLVEKMPFVKGYIRVRDAKCIISNVVNRMTPYNWAGFESSTYISIGGRESVGTVGPVSPQTFVQWGYGSRGIDM